MKCKLSSYVVKHSLTTLKYNNISQVCPYKDLGSAKVNFVKMNMYISKEVGNETKIQIIKILREQFNTISLSLKEAKDYIDSCIGEYNIFPKVVTQEKINELIRKLEPYNVSINTIKLMQQKYCTYTVRISINFVGLISQERI